MDESTVESPIEAVVGLTEKVPLRVLHVDDDSGFLKVAQQCLKMQGAFEVETATSVEEAMEKMRKKTFDVIVSDYLMPGKDGLEFLKELRDSGNTVPFIMFTGKGREEVAIKALNLDADQYLNKLGDPETVYCELAHGIHQAVQRKTASMEVWRTEQRLRAILASSPDIITASDLRGKIVDCNEAAWKLTGFSSKKELLGTSSFELIAEKDRERALENLKKTLAQGTVRNIEYTLLNKEGEEYIGELSASILKDTSGNSTGFVGVVRDITERKKTEKALRESEERFRTIFEGATDGILAADPRTQRFVFANPRVCEITGYSSEELLKLSVTDIHPKEDFPYVIDQFTKQVEGKPTLSTDIPVLKKDKQVVYCDVNSKMLKIGKQQYLVGFFRDITERKKAEEVEEKYRIMVELAPDSIITANTEGVVTSVNTTFTRLTGFSKDEIVGKRFTKVGTIRKRDLPIFQKMFTSLLRGKAPEPFEVIWKHKDGTTHPTEIHGALVKSDGKTKGFQAIIRDITARKKAEEALRDERERWIALTDNTDDTIVVADNNDIIRYINRTIPPTTPEEVIGESVYDYVSKEHHNVMRKSLEKVYKTGKPDSYEVTLDMSAINPKIGTLWYNTKVVPIKSDKEISGVIMVATNITERKKVGKKMNESEEKFRGMVETTSDWIWEVDQNGVYTYASPRVKDILGYEPEEIIGKTPFDLMLKDEAKKVAKIFGEIAKKEKPFSGLENWNVHKNGTKILLETSGIPILDEKRNLTGYRGIDRDITERRKAEESLKATLKKVRILNEKLGVVGRLTRHDVRNKLSAVTGNIFLAKQKLAGDHDALKYLGEIDSAVQQIERIFELTRNYEKLGVEELAYMDVEKSLEEAVSLVSDLHGVRVVNDCHGLTVLADSLLTQLFYNLIYNSLEHGEKVSQIRVYYEETAKDKLKLVYEDDGVGIPKAEKEQIFKERHGKATGYGLRLIRKMCRVYDWTIHETGKPGRGAEFIISIPRKGESGKVFHLVSQNR